MSLDRRADQSQQPTVGIGMPVFNCERFIEQAIESLLGQTFDDFELVIVDNHSTDRTYEISQSFAARDHRVRCVRQRQNYGFIHNFNTAFRLTSSRYFKWAACDDVCAPEFLARCVEVLERDPSVGLVYPEMPWIDETGSQVVSRPRSLDRSVLQVTASNDPAERFAAMMHNFWYTEHLYGLVRASALAQTRLYPYHFMGDHILLSELSLYGRFHRIPEPLLLLRRHGAQTSKAPTARQRLAVVQPRSPGRRYMLAVLAQYPKRLYLHVSAVHRAPLGHTARVRCYIAITRAVTRWARIRMRMRQR
jgi:glycosyltransferase involved in cell wall biosynthesis